MRPGHKVRVVCSPGFRLQVKEEVLTCVTGTRFQPATVRGCVGGWDLYHLVELICLIIAFR